jgi:hypothetical protein
MSMITMSRKNVSSHEANMRGLRGRGSVIYNVLVTE